MSGMDIPYHIQNKQEYKEKIKKIIMEEVKNETKMNYDLNKIIDNAVNIGMTRTPKIQMDYGRQPQAVGEIKKDEGFKNEIKEVMKKLLKAQQEEEDKERLAKEEDKAAERKKKEEDKAAAERKKAEAATTIQAAVRRRKARLAAAENLKELLSKADMSIDDAMNYFDKSEKTNIENIAYEFISIEVKQAREAEGGKKPAKKPKRRANKTKRAKKSNKKKRKPKRKTMRKIKKIIFR